MRVTVNGEVRETPQGTTMDRLLASLGLDPRKVAVEHNRQIVPKSQYDLILEPEDTLEIVQFVGGGCSFGFAKGTVEYQMGITPTQIRSVSGPILSTAYDNTQFHDYRLEWTSPSTARYYVDNTLIATNSDGFSAAVNRVHFGDTTGAANSRQWGLSWS